MSLAHACWTRSVRRLRCRAPWLALLLAGCAGAAYVERDGKLWHPRAPVAVPDLAAAPWAAGWERIALEGADLAWSRPGEGAIAVRVRCGTGAERLERSARDRWLGIERASLVRRDTALAGRRAIDAVAQVEGLDVRVLVVQIDACLVDLAWVAPREAAGAEVFERFLLGVGLGNAVAEGGEP